MGEMMGNQGHGKDRILRYRAVMYPRTLLPHHSYSRQGVQ